MKLKQGKRLEKIEQCIRDNQPRKVIPFIEGAGEVKRQIRTALIESFEKKEVGLTTDRIAKLIKKQIDFLGEVQLKIAAIDSAKYHRFNNPGLAVYASKQLEEYIKLVLQVRGDIENTKLQIAQQFNFDKDKDKDGKGATFEDYVLELSTSDYSFSVDETGNT